ncbi:MAG: YvcK family protein [Lachnospiraceae bacterium]|nr:YvcK family protein [Lachnospiraceae bacterium]
MSNVVVFGGGTGLSCLLSGLKLFPVDVTTIITVTDNGSSTGVLKEELDIPAVGDVGKVLLSMANVDKDYIRLLRYRFKKGETLNNHPVRNILLAALIDLKGNLTDATRYMSELLKIKGTVLPLTEEKIDLVGIGKDGNYFGEEEVSRNISKIERLTLDHPVTVSQEIQDKIRNASLIIFSPGSLYTSIIPNLLADGVKEAIDESKAPLMYVANLVTQPGETDDASLSSHLRVLNSYLGKRKLDITIANNAVINEEVTARYLEQENKKVVEIDRDNVDIDIIADSIFTLENGTIRHNALKTAYLIFSYLMDKDLE